MPDEFGNESPAEIREEIPKDSRTWGMLAHLSGLIGAVLGVGAPGFAGPLVVWLIKKDEDAFVEDQAKEAFNFQVTLLIPYAVVFAIAIMTCGIGMILFPVVWLCQIIFSVVAAVKANDGYYYRYPFNLRLLK